MQLLRNKKIDPKSEETTENTSLANAAAKNATKGKKKHKQLKRFLLRLAIIGVLVFVALQFFVGIRIVHDNGMYPSVRDGELILVSKLTRPINNAVLLYKTPDGAEHLGRLMAFAGDEVEIGEDSGVSINGNVLYNTIPYKTPFGSLIYPYIVEKNSYFILNDYREIEADSRTYGSIPETDVIGVVVFALQYREF